LSMVLVNMVISPLFYRHERLGASSDTTAIGTTAAKHVEPVSD
jgi:hypothetical protein